METVNLIMPSTNMVALDNNWKNEAEEAILISEKQEEQHFLRIMRYVYHINVS